MLARMRNWWQSVHAENAQIVDQIPESWTRGAIVLASALALYLELVIIRWHATSSHVFAIFKNVSLLSCFLGLGIGFALSARRRQISLASFLPLLAVQTVFFGILATTIGGRRVNPVAEQLVMGLRSTEWNWLHVIEGNLFLAGIFLLNSIMFIPWGYTTGRLMNRLPAVKSYSLNLLGSVLGIGVFFLLSLLWTPPSVWIGIAVLAACPFLLGSRRMMAAGVVSVGVIATAAGVIGRLEERRYYSPYQVITLRLPRLEQPAANPVIKVNSAFFQTVYDLSANRKIEPELEPVADYYNAPYLFGKKPGDVLVVGAGSGNDVAAALRNGAKTVTAVEIDPAIVYLGRRLHPERPYSDPRTKVELNDARSFLRQTDKRFDTIIYGLLDSHTNMGAMTNVRLDSFVYTLEGFQDAVARLTPNGLVAVSYSIVDKSQIGKLYELLHRAYPKHPPRVFKSGEGLTFVTGPGAVKATVPPGVTELSDQVAAQIGHVDVPTDDWPYFYMTKRAYPITYAVVIGVLFVLSWWLIRKKLGAVKGWSPRMATFFFLGAGFMLVETKVITELGLVFGNTWTVNAVAITGILIMAYLANRWILWRGSVSTLGAFAFLGVAILAGWAVTRMATMNALPMEKLLLPVVLTLPLFFAGLIFSSTLARGGAVGDALAANLFGAMLGGFLEYNSMYWGLNSLYPLGLALYGSAFVFALFDRKSGAQQADDEPAPADSIPKAA